MKSKGINILLVEDDKDHALLVEKALKVNRALKKFFHLTNGEDAIKFLKNLTKDKTPPLSIKPDLILLDLRLPKIGGLKVLDEIKQDRELRKIPVIVLSSSGAPSDIKKAYEKHANSYLVKPLDFKDFKNMIKEMSHYWLDWNIKPN